MRIFAFGHRARQGKNLACEAIREAFPKLDIAIIGFADALKDFCRDHFGMLTKDPPLLQRVGHGMREIQTDFWVRRLAARAAWSQAQGTQALLIPDLRYPNELAWVHEQGGVAVRVERYNPDGSPYIAPDRDPNHVSEVALVGHRFDYTITARETAGLQTQAVEMFRQAFTA